VFASRKLFTAALYASRYRHEMKEINQNTTRLYLDQNIIDLLVKNKSSDFEKLVISNKNIQVMYSNVTIDEISRIKDAFDRDKYLNVLKNLNARYFWVDDNEIAHFDIRSPSEIFLELTSKNQKTFRNVQQSTLDFSHKMIGGKKGTSIEDITSSQSDAFNDLMGLIENEIDVFQDKSSIDKSFLKTYPKIMKERYSNLMYDLNSQINKYHPNTENMDGLKEFRKLLNLEPIELNNIELPHIIEKIWAQMEERIKANKIDLTFADLFGEGFAKYYPNKKFTMVMKVNGIYNLLNTIGYFPDRNIEKERKFKSFVSDQQHAGMAIYSHLLLTCDKRFMKKTEAVYEYLNIGPKILFIQ